MKHAWYSKQHETLCGKCIYEQDGKNIDVTFVCDNKAEGEKYIATNWQRFTDYTYSGIVGKCIEVNKKVVDLFRELDRMDDDDYYFDYEDHPPEEHYDEHESMCYSEPDPFDMGETSS